MKLLSSYFKEMKIAARGFYFYIEVFVAVLAVVILLVAVSENPESKINEFIYYDMDPALQEYLIQEDIDKGTLEIAEPTEYKMKAVQFDVENESTGEIVSYDFKAETYMLETYKKYEFIDGDKNKKQLNKIIYYTETEEMAIRLAYQEKEIGATVAVDDAGETTFRYYNQGYETDKYNNLLLVLHNEDKDTIDAALDKQEQRKLGDMTVLNNRENIVPVITVFMGSLMGFFIVMAYIFLDKDEGVIKAFAVTPSSIWKYLLSKIMVIMTTVLISTSIIVIPIMKGQPNYLLMYLMILLSTFAFASLGLLISSFYDSISKAFGALYAFMIVMMLPAFSYFIPSFDPLWLRFFPTYPALQAIKETMIPNTDVGYVLTYCSAFLVGGLVLFMIANKRFKKSLTV